MPRRGRNRKKSRTQQHVAASSTENNTAGPQSALTTNQEQLKVPKSLVMRRGKTAMEVGTLVEDLRHLMLPYTAVHFQEDAKNRKLTLAQYATHLALPMGITHMLSFSQNHERLHLRLARTPDGPTLSFRVHRFSLNRHIQKLQKRPVSYTASLSANPPVVVTNNFGGNSAKSSSAAPPHVKLMRITFQNMFPAINVATVKLAECRRVVLFNFIEEDDDEQPDEQQHDDEQPDDADGSSGKSEDDNRLKDKRRRQLVEMRHYAIKATPVGVNRRVRRLAQDKLPNLSKCQDIADYLVGGSNNSGSSSIQSDAPSDSEPEDADGGANVVQLPDRYVGKGNHKDHKSALKLVEIGPRLTMELIKVEKGLGAGDVLYHAHVQKTPQEAAALKAKFQAAANLKQQRRATQQANVERKRQAAAEKRQAKRQRRQEREAAAMQALRSGQQLGEQTGHDDKGDDDESSDSSSDQE